ncbi:type 1 glutamine amidotransferase domain-containing protein [Luteimonas abyssi]|uniref:type 1 glutamine amidotransferase domain-containing protein n=1 Tax=Luteimonas abyssi TaxID=1247514 RepID=UPI000737B6A5|nr:type 1 glutamine amidotransferase domain-containing protein [Luteimonas abyssi]
MTMRFGVFSSLLLWVAIAHPAQAASAPTTDTVLIVVSGEGRDDGSRPGYEFDELSQAWLIFRDNGLEVEIASPRGGAVVADRYDPEAPYNARLLADAAAMTALQATRATGELSAADYAAIYVVGGKGAMFDLPVDTALQSLMADVYEQGGVLAAVCHGPAALAEVRRHDGSLLVAGRTVTGFTNEEEALFGKKWAATFPWLLEDAMRERGAHWREVPPVLSGIVVDGRLITGQNPYSTPALAEALVRATGRTPVVRAPWREERAVALVQRLLDGEDDTVATELASDRENIHVDLIGMIGYYHLQAAESPTAIESAVAVMALAAPYMDEPRLHLAIAEGWWRLEDATRARDVLHPMLVRWPDFAQAGELLQRIDGTR